MTSQRSGDEPVWKEEPAGELTEEQKAFVEALRQEFCSRFTQRGFARTVKGVDHSSLSRYLSGARTVPEWFIDRLYQHAQEQGCPLSPARRDELKRLRAAALRSSRNVNHQLQRSVEELQAALATMKVRWCVQREHAEVQQYLRTELLEDRRVLMARLEQLQRDLAATCAALAQAEAERDQAQSAHAQALRQLRAASDYVRDLHHQLEARDHKILEMAETIRRLERELAIVRHQVQLLQQEPEPPATWPVPVGQDVATLATPTVAVSPARIWPWWVAAQVALLGSLLLSLGGALYVGHLHRITFVDALWPAGGLLSLLFIATPLIGHVVSKEVGDSEGPSDGDGVVYGYYPMM